MEDDRNLSAETPQGGQKADSFAFDAEDMLGDGPAADTQNKQDADKEPSPQKTEKGEGKKMKKAKKEVDDETKAKRRHRWAVFGRVVLTVFCIGVIAMCALAIAAAMYLAKVTANDDELLDLNSLELSYATRLMAYNSENDSWEEYERVYGGENRVWISYEDMPEDLIKVTVASEDQTFWKHHGVNWKRTFTAFLNEYVPPFKGHLYSSTQGGSTITQQLIKNITEETESSGAGGALRKLREIYRAYQLERRYSKEQILEAYLNTIRLGGQVAGIESAANYYFDKTTSELTLAESAAIIVITKYPTAYNPFVDPEANKYQRENVVLWMMHNNGTITDEEYQAALDESATFVFDEPGGSAGGVDHVFSYFTETVIDEVLDDLQEYNGLTYDEAVDLFYTGGLTVYLTVDTSIQEVMEDVAENGTFWPDLEYTTDEETGEQVLADDQIQAAMVLMNFKGEVLGVTGGIRGKTVSRGSNYAVLPRNTGSSIKPIASYGPALEVDAITYSTMFPDQAIMTLNDNPWPRNYDNTYGSPVTVYDGVRRSLNTTAVQVLQLIGADFAYDFLTTSLGITTLVDGVEGSDGSILSDKGIGLTLGDLTYGISPLEMCAAYQIFGNGGTYYTPHTYKKITNAHGEVILDKEKNVQQIQAISEDTAYIMNKILQGVITSGTGTAARYGSMPLAGKTGTSSDNSDFWCIAMNPYYVMSVWEGYVPTVKYMKTIRPHPTQVAFKEVMSRVCEDLEYKDFPEKPDNVVSAAYCKTTGDLASSSCTDTAIGYYKEENMPDYCNHVYVPTEEELAAMNGTN